MHGWGTGVVGVRRVFAVALAVAIASVLVTASRPAEAAAATIKVNVDRVDCGWDPTTGTLWPAIQVARTGAAADTRVSARMVLKGAGADRSLGAGRVLKDGGINQSGFVDGPQATTGVAPLQVGKAQWIRPWGGRFGDAVNGGAKLTAARSLSVQIVLYDFNAGVYVDSTSVACRTSGAFQLTSKTYSTTAFAAGKTKLPLANVVYDLAAAPLPSQWAKLMQTCAPAVDSSAGSVAQSFCWSNTGTGDANDFTGGWYPQGLTSSSESGVNGEPVWSGVPAGKDVLLISSYLRKASGTGEPTRLAVVDASANPKRYLNVVLYEPCTGGAGCQSGFKPLLDSHVGGLAWAGKYLYVADTARGFKVFDLTQFYKQAGPTYALPQVMQYSQPTSATQCSLAVTGSVRPCTLDFSFASIANGAPYRLVAGEFSETADTARIVSWPLLSTGLIDTTAAGRDKQKDELVTGSDLVKFQGVAVNGNTTVLSASYAQSTVANSGKTHRITTRSPWTNSGSQLGMAAVTRKAPRGIEDLAASKTRNVVWSISEFPGRRWIWATTYPAAFG